MRTLALAALLALSACGGSHHDDGPGQGAGDAPAPKQDAYFTAVLAIAGSGAENADEPQAVEAVALTMPEDSEPVALP